MYEYLIDYCSGQMKKAYDQSVLDEKDDFFDRVWAASVMKVENLKKHPHVSDFILSAATEQASDMRESLKELFREGEKFTRGLVLREADRIKFRNPEDAGVMLRTLRMLAQGLVQEIDRGRDYDEIMEEFSVILSMYRRNFYKEEYRR